MTLSLGKLRYCFPSFRRFLSCCRCWKCRSELKEGGVQLIKCCSCGSIQRAPPITAEPGQCCPDFYRLLLPKSKWLADGRRPFDVDLRALKQQYLELQALAHPDKLGRGGGEDGSLTNEPWSAWINRAHDTLKSPLQRAIYLLNFYTGQKSAPQSPSEVVDNPNDISRILEIREELDSATDAVQIARIQAENDARIRETCGQLTRILDVDRAKDLETVKRCINDLRYWMSIDAVIKEKL